MKKLWLLLTIMLSVLILTSCGGLYSAGFKQNHGLSKKSISTISTVKGGSKSFCKSH